MPQETKQKTENPADPKAYKKGDDLTFEQVVEFRRRVAEKAKQKAK